MPENLFKNKATKIKSLGPQKEFCAPTRYWNLRALPIYQRRTRTPPSQPLPQRQPRRESQSITACHKFSATPAPLPQYRYLPMRYSPYPPLKPSLPWTTIQTDSIEIGNLERYTRTWLSKSTDTGKKALWGVKYAEGLWSR